MTDLLVHGKGNEISLMLQRSLSAYLVMNPLKLGYYNMKAITTE